MIFCVNRRSLSIVPVEPETSQMKTVLTYLRLALLVSVVAAIGGQSAVASEPSGGDIYNTPEVWKRMETREGKEQSTLRLESVVAPDRVVFGKPWRLVLSIKNIGDQPVRSAKQHGQSDYLVLVRASNGNLVPLTEKGRKLFAIDQSGGFHFQLIPGHAIGTSLAMQDLFDFREPGEYEVLASVTLTGEISGGLVSKKLKVIVHNAK